MIRPDLYSPCSFRGWKEHEESNNRFQSYLSGSNAAAQSADVSTASPSTAGNRSRIGLKTSAGFFLPLNRVTAENRFRRLRMRRNGARPSDSPTLLNSAAGGLYWPKAGCNSGRRNKASVGMANHCARLLKMRSDSPTVRNAPSKPLLTKEVRGGLCSLLPSGTVSVNKQ